MEVQLKDFTKISDFLWEIPKTFRKKMRVPARIYASEEILKDALRNKSVEQLINTTTLPGIVNYSIAMPDIHEGYGFPIGGVAATKYPNGIISPGGIGFDQNCGMRLLFSEHSEEDIKPYLEEVSKEIQKVVPSGLGKGAKKILSTQEIDNILKYGAKFLAEKGFGEKEDIENCESNGYIEEADPSFVSQRAKNRSKDQVGTLGSGNHFLEIQKVEEIFDEGTAKTFGLFKDQTTFMAHTGSRALGHQNATDYIRKMENKMPKYKINMPDRELVCAPLSSKEGKEFFSAMCCGANFAWANRQMIIYNIRKAVEKMLGKSVKLRTLYDVAHNIAKIEEHKITINGKEKIAKLIVHRKGATRAFPPGHPEIPEKYKSVGQPVLIPGSMGTSSYVLAGTEKGKETFFSASHGGGRLMSRREAIRKFPAKEILKELKEKEIVVRFSSFMGISEEAPQAYKNIENVVNILDKIGLLKKVARLKPAAVIKGE